MPDYRGSEKTVLVDMDGVLFDFDEGVEQQLRTAYPEIYASRYTDRPADFYTANNYPERFHDQIWAISNASGFIATLPLIDGALDGWQRILDADLHPRICSTLLPKEFAPHCEEEKIAALEEHFVPRFGSWVVESALFTPHKHWAIASVLIDDKNPPIRDSETATWGQLVFDQPYNRTPEAEGYTRLDGWRDPDLIDKIYATKQQRIDDGIISWL